MFLEISWRSSNVGPFERNHCELRSEISRNARSHVTI